MYLQETNTEHEHDVQFLLQGHVQAVKLWHWQTHYQYVEQNVECGTQPSLEVDVVAFGGKFTVPSFPGTVDGLALPDGNTLEGYKIHHICCDQDIDAVLEAPTWEDANVEKEDGDFRQW